MEDVVNIDVAGIAKTGTTLAAQPLAVSGGEISYKAVAVIGDQRKGFLRGFAPDHGSGIGGKVATPEFIDKSKGCAVMTKELECACATPRTLLGFGAYRPERNLRCDETPARFSM